MLCLFILWDGVQTLFTKWRRRSWNSQVVASFSLCVSRRWEAAAQVLIHLKQLVWLHKMKQRLQGFRRKLQLDCCRKVVHSFRHGADRFDCPQINGKENIFERGLIVIIVVSAADLHENLLQKVVCSRRYISGHRCHNSYNNLTAIHCLKSPAATVYPLSFFSPFQLFSLCHHL